MNKLIISILLGLITFLTACSVKNPITHQYKLDCFSAKSISAKRSAYSILVSQPDAVAAYQTEQMLYKKKPFELNTFAHNAWISSPANMLFPLIIQSLHDSDYFYAVETPPYADKTDYRLDTQIIELHQNFLVKPSRIEFVAKIMLTETENDRIIVSKMIRKSVATPAESPYGGVVAANVAVKSFTADLTNFVIRYIQHDKR